MSSLESSPLLLRDLRTLKRQAWRTRFFALIVLLFLAQLVAAYFLRTPVYGSSTIFGGENFLILCSYFLGIHAIIHGLAAMWAYDRARAVRSNIEELIVTPLAQSVIFWWIWRRSFVLSLAILLAVYLPLLLPFDMLYTLDVLETIHDAPSPTRPIFAILCGSISDMAMVSLLWLPWVSNRILRRIIVSIAVIAFVWTIVALNFPQAWSGLAEFLLQEKVEYAGDLFDAGNVRQLVPVASLTRWHPVLTLSYMLISTAYYCGLGVMAGLEGNTGTISGIRKIVLYGPLLEFGFYHIIALYGGLESYNPLMALFLMLSLYASAAGTIWLGFKWNLLFMMSRREIRCRD